MKSRTTYFSLMVGLAVLLALISGLTACSSTTTTPAATTVPPTSTTIQPASTTPPATTSSTAALTVKVSNNAKLGGFLVDGKGMTLYYFAKDTFGTSNASGAVLQTWPIFYNQNIVIPSSLDAGDFTTIARADGNKQTAYYGWPLYYYAGDKAAGDTNGDGVGGVWFAVKVPWYTVLIQNKATIGNYLADTAGMTLYWTSRDVVGQSNITGTTLANWPVFYSTADSVPTLVIPSALNTADFGTITRADGKKQTTYKGWPLYYYIQDKTSGDTNGQGVGGVWFVATPAASGPAPSPTPTATPVTTPTSTQTPTPPPSSTTAAPAPYSINIQGFAFSPATLTIPVGSKVTWTNSDSVGHTVTSDSGAFNGTVNNGASFSFTFTQAGTFPYHCSIHPSMVAKIIVQ